MTEAIRRRLGLAIRLERTAVWVRYFLYAVLVGVYVAGHSPGNRTDLWVITGTVLIHNFLVHACLWRHRYEFFSSKWNFLVYLIETSIIVKFTGAEESEFYVFYPFLVAGYTIHTVTFGRILLVSLICSLAYSGIILQEWWTAGIRMSPLDIAVKLAIIPLSGWLTATMVQLRRVAEETSRERTKELASSEAMLRAILDSTAEPVLVFSERESLSESNKGAADFLSRSEEMLRGESLSAILGADTATAVMSTLSGSGQYQGEHTVTLYDGRQRTVDVSARPFRRHDHTFMVVVLHDVTEQHELQEATRLANARLARLNRELQRTNELKSELITQVTRRLCSPLSAVMGYIDLLLHDEATVNLPEHARILQNCRRDAARIFELLEDTTQTVAVHSHAEEPRTAE